MASSDVDVDCKQPSAAHLYLHPTLVAKNVKAMFSNPLWIHSISFFVPIKVEQKIIVEKLSKHQYCTFFTLLTLISKYQGVCVCSQECSLEMVHLCMSLLACMSQYMLACSYAFYCVISPSFPHTQTHR